MPITVILFVLSFMLSGHVSIVSVAKSNKITLPIVDYITKANEQKLPEGIQENSNSQKLKVSNEFKTPGQVRWSDVPLTSTDKINTDESNMNAVTTKFDIMIESPTRNKHVKSDRYTYRSRSYHNEVDAENDQNSEFSTGHVNTLPTLMR